jgi:hypothetical protein
MMASNGGSMAIAFGFEFVKDVYEVAQYSIYSLVVLHQ